MSSLLFNQAFQDFEKTHTQSPSWVQTLRTDSKKEFLARGLPTLRNESWKYTSLRKLSGTDYVWSSVYDSSLTQMMKSFFIPGAHNFVFVDGILQGGHQTEFSFCTLEEGFQKFPELVQKSIQLSNTVFQNSLTLMNDAFLSQGSFLHLTEEKTVSAPVHFLNIITSHSHPRISLPRHIVYLEKHAKLTLFESIVSLKNTDAEDSVFNSITDIILEKQAECSYAKFEHTDTKHIYLGHTRVFHRSESKSFCFYHLGKSAVSREDIHIHLSEEECESRVRGIFHTSQKEHVDYSVGVNHAASHTKSRLLFKGVAEDASRGVFNAHIRVQEGLKKIDAHQMSQNLLLGEEAEIDTKPHLEIDSDDVKCAHGAAVGRMRADELFYLQARGIVRSKAEKILSTAFTQDVILDIKNESFRNEILSHKSRMDAGVRL